MSNPAGSFVEANYDVLNQRIVQPLAQVPILPTASAPANPNSLWINDANGHIYRGNSDLESMGSGTITGPGSSTDNKFARWDGVTGLVIQDGLVGASDTGIVSGLIAETFTAQASNPGGTDTIWVDSVSGHLFRGAVDVETVGSGDVVGPVSSTDNAIARYDGTSGQIIQNSLVTISDLGFVDGLIAIDETPQASNPSGVDTIWINSTNSHVYHGSRDIENVATVGQISMVSVGGDSIGPLT